MVSLGQWSRASHQRAIDNARSAATELSRLRVEREDVELFLAEVATRRTAKSRPA